MEVEGPPWPHTRNWGGVPPPGELSGGVRFGRSRHPLRCQGVLPNPSWYVFSPANVTLGSCQEVNGKLSDGFQVTTSLPHRSLFSNKELYYKKGPGRDGGVDTTVWAEAPGARQMVDGGWRMANDNGEWMDVGC